MKRDGPRPLTRSELKNRPLPVIEPADKNDHGKLLVIGGNRSTPGSTILCATAALRVGCGKVTIATVEPVAPHVALAVPECKVLGLPMNRQGGFARSAIKQLVAHAKQHDAVVAGPGLYEDKVCVTLAEGLIEAQLPRLVLDAALLHALPAHDRKVRDAAMPILLPHSGEMASLIQCDASEIEDDPLRCGRACAARYGALTLVKGAVSHVVTPTGDAWRFSGGVPGLGISGSGDTLAGIVGGLLARDCDPLSALLWGVLLHGEAGKALSKKVGQVGFLARELAGELPALLQKA